MKRIRRRILGQHFLTNPRILDEMIEHADLSRSDVVLEVGAGRGELTKRLAEKAGKVIAVEIDPSFTSDLQALAEACPNVELIIGDVLKVRPTGFNKVVANPPYSISSKLVEWLIESKPELMVLTLQREFASKLVASPGSPKYLYISVVSSLAYDSKILRTVPRSFFNPPPKVDSAMILMKKKAEIPELKDSWKRFWKMLFTRRRQLVRKVLAGMLRRGLIDESGFKNIPENLLSKRVFQLAPNELLMLAETLKPS
ncbi:MAG: ribosomal RNA small subunit methyltransferase A [Thaumarchaeota archaeon]|nr:ribosomal RNA small subunit methyltransferase A [Nitrososphaerota archaeon]